MILYSVCAGGRSMSLNFRCCGELILLHQVPGSAEEYWHRCIVMFFGILGRTGCSCGGKFRRNLVCMVDMLDAGWSCLMEME